MKEQTFLSNHYCTNTQIKVLMTHSLNEALAEGNDEQLLELLVLFKMSGATLAK